jgi:hypothetical protein
MQWKKWFFPFLRRCKEERLAWPWPALLTKPFIIREVTFQNWEEPEKEISYPKNQQFVTISALAIKFN